VGAILVFPIVLVAVAIVALLVWTSLRARRLPPTTTPYPSDSAAGLADHLADLRARHDADRLPGEPEPPL
jgi:hypothetical protein